MSASFRKRLREKIEESSRRKKSREEEVEDSDDEDEEVLSEVDENEVYENVDGDWLPNMIARVNQANNFRNAVIHVPGDDQVDKILTDMGFYKYLRRKIDKMSTTSAKEALQTRKRSACFIAFLLLLSGTEVHVETVISTLKEIARPAGHKLLYKYTEFLRAKGYKPQTICNNIDYTRKLLYWAVYEVPNLYKSNLQHYERSIAFIKSKYRRLIPKGRKRETIQKRVKSRTWPSKGVVQLLVAVETATPEQLTWANDIALGTVRFSWRRYNMYLGCLLGAVFTGAPQGRGQGVEKMTYKQFIRFLDNGDMPHTDKLKSALTYGHQVITLSEGPCEDLLRAYVDIVRPAGVQCLKDRNITKTGMPSLL
jgi:hypothetical protein